MDASMETIHRQLGRDLREVLCKCPDACSSYGESEGWMDGVWEGGIGEWVDGWREGEREEGQRSKGVEG